jgi:predicted Fe-Mo cluster-binding NifX family protein
MISFIRQRPGTLVAVYRREDNEMKVAIPIFRDRVSPVYDAAETVLILEFDDRRETSRYRLDLQGGALTQRVEKLSANGVDVLLCGAISRPLYDMLELAGIKVRPFLSGDVDRVLRAYLDGRLSEPQFSMPGCCEKRRRRRTGRRFGPGRERGRS